ncbi:MAG: aspartate kinase [Prolixibacteraceae bacterium]|jgi:aspartate kinase|nr:aspartate kinase [Prolixibacteraceae bacterium]MDI9564546.1 aspartate kinase [Bacteroidota bacterium]NLS98932.1 aspartate kinase [Bacteroidales bacterium]HNZ69108.1 aspartate kinase [Prolixibacteraceae bacterium]HOC86596.1 aspartate kinase [Prolixibacteraceae bacterium]
MKVFKFGGASLKDAAGVRNVASIVAQYDSDMIVVASAMGKMTNLLEALAKAHFNGWDETMEIYEKFRRFHLELAGELFGSETEIPTAVFNMLSDMENRLRMPPSLLFDFEYDQFVCYGELLSSLIVSLYLETAGMTNRWVDIRSSLRTDDKYRDASVNWKWTEMLVNNTFQFNGTRMYVTQGFIGSTVTNLTTSLGREGSDYTAAILASLLKAESVTIWKDVPGVLNADPKQYQGTILLKELSYREAIEMTYSGAQVIHPKTMKPLYNSNIPLYVRSFANPSEPGTVIHQVDHPLELTPVFITKGNQVLITFSPYDFSFISAEDISRVFALLSAKGLKVNLIQKSAIDLSLLVDAPELGLETIMLDLRKDYEVKYNTGLTLVTIRHYNNETIERLTAGKKIFIEQYSRLTAKIAVN